MANILFGPSGVLDSRKEKKEAAALVTIQADALELTCCSASSLLVCGFAEINSPVVIRDYPIFPLAMTPVGATVCRCRKHAPA